MSVLLGSKIERENPYLENREVDGSIVITEV